MTVNPLVVEELRALFKAGATPSRLIEHLVTRHGGEPNEHALIQEYFREAFGVAIVRGLRPFDDYRHEDLRYAFLNQDLLHEMIEKQASWNPGRTTDNSGERSWLDSLTATDPTEQVRKAEATGMPELADVWNSLKPAERSVINRIIAGFNTRAEMATILARLAERLQQQVRELTKELRKEPTRNGAEAAGSKTI
jgi:hypothetical protein